MDPKYDRGPMLLAPGASSSASSASFPARERNSSSSYPPSGAFPPVDEHLVQPEISNYEIIRGRKVMTMGANPPHAEAHTRADFLIMPHVREGYVASSDLLTRVNEGSNFATDVSIRREGLDPRTGARYLEEISFEIVNEQTMRDVTDKAEDLIRRGVRRVFAIFVKESRVSEWSAAKHKFVSLDIDGMLEDRLFIRPMAVRGLVNAALAENEVALALWKKGNPALKRIQEDGHKEGHEEGHKEGQREMLVRLLERRFGPLSESMLSRIQSADTNALRAWADGIFDATSVDDVFGVEK